VQSLVEKETKQSTQTFVTALNHLDWNRTFYIHRRHSIRQTTDIRTKYSEYVMVKIL